METQIYDTLSKKSSNELKAYIINMSEGYKPEAVETAITILKERGENIEDLLRTAQVEVCARCNNRQQSKEGLICSLTGRRADFLCNCSNFSRDDAAAKEQERMKKEKDGWSGFMSFYWFTLAVGAVLTFVMAIMTFKPEESLWLAISDLVLLVGYSALCIYTIIAFAKRLPNAVKLGKIQNYTLIALNSLNLIYYIAGLTEPNWGGSSFRLIGSLIWAGIFLIYLYTSTEIKAVYPKESQHFLSHDKPILWSVFGVVVALLIAGIMELAIKEANQPISELRSYVQNYNDTISINTSEDSYCKGLEMTDSMVIVSRHSTTYENGELTPVVLKWYPVYTKELMFFYPQGAGAELLEKCYNANYGISLCWYDRNDVFTYSIDLTPSDIKTIVEEEKHETSLDVWRNFLSGWNEQFPSDYLGGSAVYTSAEIINDCAVVNLTLKDVSSSDLVFLTNDYLKSYVNENFDAFNDSFITLAMLNKLEIQYRFDAGRVSKWSETVTLTKEELY